MAGENLSGGADRPPLVEVLKAELEVLSMAERAFFEGVLELRRDASSILDEVAKVGAVSEEVRGNLNDILTKMFTAGSRRAFDNDVRGMVEEELRAATEGEEE
ncbi:MAG: hypothetical protein WC651_02045 [Candidatus Gracilibacteria bacterium]|jgi:hypothetical protein